MLPNLRIPNLDYDTLGDAETALTRAHPWVVLVNAHQLTFTALIMLFYSHCERQRSNPVRTRTTLCTGLLRWRSQ